jgi:hypothetical protein
MPQIINPFRPQNTPLAQAITQVGKDIYGDQLTPALKREQLIAAQRGNVETDALAQSFADPAGGVDYQAMILSGYKPSDAADARLMQQAEAFGARAPQTQSAQIGAGQGYDNTADAFGTKIATERRGQDIASSDRRFGFNLNDSTERWKFSNTPEEAMVNGQPVFLPREKVYGDGVSPILSDAEKGRNMRFNESVALYGEVYPESTMEQRKQYALQQESKSQGQKITIGPDGTTIESGGAYGEPTNSVISGVQESLAASDVFDSSIEEGIKMAERSPLAFGVPGIATGMAQDVAAIAESVGLVRPDLGVDGSLKEVEGRLAASGLVDPSIFAYNPDVSNVDKLARLMAYQGAEALLNQTGRSVSNQDFNIIMAIVGDPKGWFMNQRRYVEGLRFLQGRIDMMVDIKRKQAGLPPITAERALRRSEKAKMTVPGAPVPGAPAASAAPAPGGAITVNSEQEALSQPPGTIVILNGRRFKVEE